MCGIVGYVGSRPAQELLLAGLRKLEYRGYDSAGISVVIDDEITSVRAVGNLDHLEEALVIDEERNGTQSAATGIAHTRWATHGRVNEVNAHPHSDNADRVHVVVNGIVENYLALKQRMIDDGARFTSETDAEVVAHLVSHHYDGDLREAVRRTFADLEGHYAFVAMCVDDPGTLIGARQECPLVIGRGEGETFLASAVPAFLASTRHVQALENGEIVEISTEGARIFGADGVERPREVTEIDWDEETAEKGGYDTFMLKEIHDQPDAVAETVADRTVRPDGVDLDDVGALDEQLLRDVDRIVIVACGTSFNAGLIGRYAIEEWARVPVDMDIASEFRYRNPIFRERDLVIGITQSGETADTLAAMRVAKEAGAKVLAITNMRDSQVTRDADGVLFTRAGLEVSVAATKTFVCQVAVLYLLALRLAELRGELDTAQLTELVAQVKHLPHLIDELLRRLLPVPGAPRRPRGRPGRRAEAQGGGVHRHRCVCRRGDEARSDRPAGREDAGGLHRHRLADPRQDGLQHAGGSRPGCARDRDRHRGQHRDRRTRRDRDLHPADRLDAPAAARRHSAAAARVRDRPHAWPQRRPATQSRQDRDRGVGPEFTRV